MSNGILMIIYEGKKRAELIGQQIELISDLRRGSIITKYKKDED